MIKFDKINFGVSLLKMFMCFEVICNHFLFYDVSVNRPFFELKVMAVPVFMFASFLFVGKYFNNMNLTTFGRREWRLFLPHLFWSVVYFVFRLGEQYILHTDKGINYKSLIWQIFTGHKQYLNTAMWFQVVLIALTALFFVIKLIKNVKIETTIFLFLFLLSFYLQYSGLNYEMFGSLRDELKYPLGRVFEMIPYAVLGYIVSNYSLFDLLKKKKTLFCILGLIISLTLYTVNSFVPLNIKINNFGYAGIYPLVFTLTITAFAYLLPLDKLNIKAKKVLEFISRYTMGIYCVHFLTGSILEKIFEAVGIRTNGILICVSIYIVSFFGCFIISKIPIKFLKKTVN